MLKNRFSAVAILLSMLFISAFGAKKVTVLYPDKYHTFYKYDTVMIKYTTENMSKFEVECKVMDYNVMGHQYNNYLRIGMIDPYERVCARAGSIRGDNPHYFNFPWIIDDWCKDPKEGLDWPGPKNWLNVDMDSALIRMADYESNDPFFSPSYFALRWTPRPGGPKKFELGGGTIATDRPAVRKTAQSRYYALSVTAPSTGIAGARGNAVIISNGKGAAYLPSGRMLGRR